MDNPLSMRGEENSITAKRVILSILIIAIIFVLIRTVNLVYGVYIINQEYVTILLALLIASFVIAIVLRRVQQDLYSEFGPT